MSDVNLALTVAGQSLMAKIQAGQGIIPLEITRVVTSSGTSVTPLELTALTEEQQTFIITGREIMGARTTIRTYLNNFGNPAGSIPPLAQGYPLAQIGFYALDPDDGEILMRISQFENPNYVPAATERAWEFEPSFNFITGNASTVIVHIEPANNATRQDVYNSVDVSTNAPANVGVRTQYFIESDVPDYQPLEPETDLILQGTFDPTTGLDENDEPIPEASEENEGFYWTASVAGSFTPPGAGAELTFNLDDWLVSDGVAFTSTPPIPDPGLLFTEAQITEVRIIADPSNAHGSPFRVVLPKTVISAVRNPATRESLVQILAHITGYISSHTGNVDVHVTAAWTNNVQQMLAQLVEFTQRTDIFVTPEQKAAWDAAIVTANNALALAQTNAGLLNDVEGRLSQVEDSLFSGIASNPFIVTFGSLNGILVTLGVWNPVLHRVEC